MNVLFQINEEFFVEDEEIDLSILDDDDDNFEKQLEARLQAFVKDPDPQEIERKRLIAEKAEDERQAEL